MPPEPQPQVVPYIHDHTKREPIPELADIWPRFQQIVFAQTDLNNHAEKFPEQQLSIAREGRLSLPSPFSDGTDTCTKSYYLHYQFFYRFLGVEEYFWSTTVPEQLLAAIYFPSRGVAVCLYPGAIDQDLIANFERLRGEVPKRNGTGATSADRRALVVGFSQFMHMLWNHLPALEHAIEAGVATRLPVAVTHEPFGPTEELFPELAGRTMPLPSSEVVELNRTHPMLVGLGSRRIPRSVRERVRRVARQRAGAAALADRDLFRAGCTPIFWLSIKPPDRTCLNQAEALGAIIAEIKQTYPDAEFVLDGPSRPWDLEGNDNYGSDFREYLDREIASAARVIEEVTERLDAGQRASVVALCGASACDEIAWEEIADFYFCHGGTPHHKIGWVHDTPGMLYSNSRFISYYQWMNPLEPPPKTYYLPARLVADDADSNYPPEKLARKDQNFTLLAPRDIAHEILNAYRDSQMPDQTQPEATPPGSEAHADSGDSLAAPDEPAAPAPDTTRAADAASRPDYFRIPEHTGLPAQELVRLLHAHLRPKTYLEIGAPNGGTLAAAHCDSVVIGERIALSGDMVGDKPSCSLFQMSADDFFAAYDPKRILNGPIEVAFLHGLHLFESLLRAFRNVERHCKPNSIVLVDGCVPTDAHAARREMSDSGLAGLSVDANRWIGDGWKLPVILKKARPELRIRAFNATPAGLVAITNLDPNSDLLDKQYFSITEQLGSAILNQQGVEAYMKAMSVAGTEVFGKFESLSALFWL